VAYNPTWHLDPVATEESESNLYTELRKAAEVVDSTIGLLTTKTGNFVLLILLSRPVSPKIKQGIILQRSDSRRETRLSDWDQQFSDMRAQFLARAQLRLGHISDAIERLQNDVTDDAVLLEVRRHFHWLSGIGGTYKLPAVSELGMTGEEICDSLVEENKQPSLEDVLVLKQLLHDATQRISEA